MTAYVTNTTGVQLADVAVRHRHRARCEDRIRGAKNTDLQILPLTGFTRHQIWIAIVLLATGLTAWLQMVALTSHSVVSAVRTTVRLLPRPLVAALLDQW